MFLGINKLILYHKARGSETTGIQKVGSTVLSEDFILIVLIEFRIPGPSAQIDHFSSALIPCGKEGLLARTRKRYGCIHRTLVCLSIVRGKLSNNFGKFPKLEVFRDHTGMCVPLYILSGYRMVI